jgi:hypothetical protein
LIREVFEGAFARPDLKEREEEKKEDLRRVYGPHIGDWT